MKPFEPTGWTKQLANTYHYKDYKLVFGETIQGGKVTEYVTNIFKGSHDSRIFCGVVETSEDFEWLCGLLGIYKNKTV
jgi:hypothetical protein